MNSATREAYAAALVELANTNPDVVVLDADLADATKSVAFKKVAPERFFDMGIAEADMVSTAAGLATCGKIPFASSFSVFVTGRSFEQVRNCVCYPNLNVKIVGSHAGPSCGEDGGTHQAVEDIALMRALPGMVVVVPADDVEAKAATIAASKYVGPMYLRMARLASPTMHDEASYVFDLWRAEMCREGSDVTVVACGMMVPAALEAAETLAEEGVSVEVINMHTVKPLDEAALLASARKTRHVVTVEEASVVGGLGGAVCECLSERLPTPVCRIGMPDIFGKSGPGADLLVEYGLCASNIARVCREIIA